MKPGINFKSGQDLKGSGSPSDCNAYETEDSMITHPILSRLKVE